MQQDIITKVSIKNILLNSALALMKIIAGVFANSLAVINDGLNSLFDVITTVIVLISSYFTQKPYDKEHQYGHEKIESIASFFTAIFLVAVALFTAYKSIVSLINKEVVEQAYLALGVSLVSAAVKSYMYLSTRNAAKKINSDILHLVAVDFRFDILLSSSVFVGVLMTMFGLWFFEPVVAIISSVILIISASMFIKKAFNQLVDKSADDETIQVLCETAMSCDGVKNIDQLMTRLHGNLIYVDIEISVEPDITVKEGHNIAQLVHDKLEDASVFKVKHCNVHINPFYTAEIVEK